MTREELKEYAAANRSRLEKQKVELGDLVMILVGEFAGENGVVKGISVCGNDFTDPYYEVDMHREVPDKYKCRKTLIQPNNVIGGLSASEFEVICNLAPDTEPTADKIKGGAVEYALSGVAKLANRLLEIARANKKAKEPKFKVGDKVIIDNILSAFDSKVGTITYTQIGKNVNYGVKIQNDIITVDEASLEILTEPTDRESEDKPKPTFHIGDKVVARISDENIRKGWIGRVTAVGMNFVQVRFANYPSELYNVRMDMLAPYTGADVADVEKEASVKVGARVKTPFGMGVVENIYNDGSFIVSRLDDGDYCFTVRKGLEKAEQQPTDEEREEKLQSRLDNADSASSILNILREETVPTPAWQSYRMELAAKIAVAYAEQGRYEPYEIRAKAVEVADGVVERLKNSDI